MLLFMVSQSHAQQPGSPEALLKSGDEFASLWNYPAALVRYEEVLGSIPTHPEALWKASLFASRVSQMMTEPETRLKYLDKGLGYANQCLLADSGSTHAWFAKGLNLFYRIQDQPVKDRIKLLPEVRYCAMRCLLFQSTHPGGWFLYGYWHLDLSGMTNVELGILRNQMKLNELPPFQYAYAVKCFNYAVANGPEMVMYKYFLALAYAKNAQPDLAKMYIQKALAQAVFVTEEERYQKRASQLLQSL